MFIIATLYILRSGELHIRSTVLLSRIPENIALMVTKQSAQGSRDQ